MRGTFKITGVSKPNSLTCEPLDNENIFWVRSHLTQERFNALFNYFAGDWSVKKFVEIEHDGLNKDGIPINPVCISIK